MTPIQTLVPEKAAVYMCAVAKYMMLLLLLSQWWILVQIPQTWMTALLSSAIINTRSTLTMTLHVVIRQVTQLKVSIKLCSNHIFSEWNNLHSFGKKHTFYHVIAKIKNMQRSLFYDIHVSKAQTSPFHTNLWILNSKSCQLHVGSISHPSCVDLVYSI